MLNNVQGGTVQLIYVNADPSTTNIFIDPDTGESLDIGMFCWQYWGQYPSVPYQLTLWKNTVSNALYALKNMSNIVFDANGNVSSCDLEWVQFL